MKYLLLILINYIIPIYTLKGSCYTCIWIRYSQTNFCAKYNQNCNKAINNCTLYEIDKEFIIY